MPSSWVEVGPPRAGLAGAPGRLGVLHAGILRDPRLSEPYPRLACHGGCALSWPLTAEERLLRDTAREFAQREVAPTAIERDEQERFDRSIFARMGELGLTGAPLPESVGGGGFSYLGWALVMEEIGAADMASAVTLSVHLLSQFPMLNYGTEEQVARWLPPMVAGEALGAFCLTEAQCRFRTRARRSGPRARAPPSDVSSTA